jgi:hypothetical protein
MPDLCLACAQLDDASTGQLIEHFEALVDHLRRTNPVVQQFTTMYEQNFQAAGAAAAPEQQQQAVPIVASTTLGPGVAASQVMSARDSGHHLPTPVPLLS